MSDDVRRDQDGEPVFDSACSRRAYRQDREIDRLRAELAKKEEALQHILQARMPPSYMSGDEVCDCLREIAKKALEADDE